MMPSSSQVYRLASTRCTSAGSAASVLVHSWPNSSAIRSRAWLQNRSASSAAAFDHAVKQIPARRWLGLKATPYRRGRKTADGWGEELPELALPADSGGSRPAPVLRVHPTGFCYVGEADPSAPGGIAAVYRELVTDDARTHQIAGHVADALQRGRNCLVLTKCIAHLDRLADALCDKGRDPVVLRGGMGARARAAALARLHPQPGGPPLLVVATRPYIGEGFDCPALDTLFLAAPVGYKGSIVQWAGRILRARPGKTTAEIHDYHDIRTPVLAATLARRAPGSTHLGFPDPRRSGFPASPGG
jgi:hypothetical protein